MLRDLLFSFIVPKIAVFGVNILLFEPEKRPIVSGTFLELTTFTAFY
jgi:hypothetical protein